jgi:twitching motility protein PilT
MITDPDQTDRLREVIAEGEYYGMQTFDQALLKHYQAGRVSMDDALRVATSPHDFKLLVAGDGRTSTSMADLSEAAERSAAAGRGHGPAAPPTAAPPPPSVGAPAGPSQNGHSAPPPGFLS